MKREFILIIIFLILIAFFSIPLRTLGLPLRPFDRVEARYESYRPASPEARSWHDSEFFSLESSEPKFWREIPYLRVTFRELCDRLLELGIGNGGYQLNSFAPKTWGYRAIPIGELRRFLEWYAKGWKMGRNKFIAGSDFWLCTDAALDLLAAARRWYPEIAIAFTWGFPAYANYSTHAFCIFMDTERKIWVIDWVRGIVMPIEEEPGLILRGLMLLFM